MISKSILSAHRDLSALSAVALSINVELQQYSLLQLMDPISIHIINQMSVLNKLNVFLLAKSLLRFSDFENQVWYDIINSGFLKIRQRKTKKILLLSFKIYNSELKSKLLSFVKIPQDINYNSISSEILQIVRRDLSHLNLHFKHQCHIFRHLFASWSNDCNVPVNSIAVKLGNTPATVKSHYIHTNLHL